MYHKKMSMRKRGDDVTHEDPKLVTMLFNEQINNQDLHTLTDMMTEDHTFIDSEGDVVKGKEEMSKAWAEFFTSYPDYRNIFTRIESRGNLVVIMGYSECSYTPLHGPALWTALIRDGKVAEWRVYDDTPQNRKKLHVE
jgi:ketosteroid isomerase-like protein